MEKSLIKQTVHTIIYVISVIFLFFIIKQFYAPKYDGELTFIIRPGQTSYEIFKSLEQNKIIRNRFVSHAYYFITKGTLFPGEYVFTGDMTFYEVIEKIRNRQRIIRKFTVPEGWTVTQIINSLSSSQTFSGIFANIPKEGYLLPETYFYSREDDRQKMVERMQKAMQKELEKAWKNRKSSCFLKSPHEVLVLASIVEKESSVKSERPRIAAIFLNRLKKGMPLQADPTVVYAITKGKFVLERPLTKDDLKTVSPYNTYTVKGLPPEPIACPGVESLQAVTNPDDSQELYFVADGNGGHNFSNTLARHNDNVAQWRKKKNQQKANNDNPF